LADSIQNHMARLHTPLCQTSSWFSDLLSRQISAAGENVRVSASVPPHRLQCPRLPTPSTTTRRRFWVLRARQSSMVHPEPKIRLECRLMWSFRRDILDFIRHRDHGPSAAGPFLPGNVEVAHDSDYLFHVQSVYHALWPQF
jgi:hypothetical protein